MLLGYIMGTELLDNVHLEIGSPLISTTLGNAISRYQYDIVCLSDTRLFDCVLDDTVVVQNYRVIHNVVSEKRRKYCSVCEKLQTLRWLRMMKMKQSWYVLM